MIVDEQKRILGVWDLGYASTKLGFLIIFLEELLQESELNNHKVDLAFVKGSGDMDLQFFSSLAAFLPVLGSVFFFDSNSQFQSWHDFSNRMYKVWPPTRNYEQCSYLGSLLTVQDQYTNSKCLIPLRAGGDIAKYSRLFLNDVLGDELLPVVLHLKNNPLDPQSNANEESWSSLFEYARNNKLPVKFILVGDDEFHSSYSGYENVIRARNFSDSLSFYLSVIQYSFIFMGMSSGFCNMALLSNMPYLIWKHPDHHPEEMEREMHGGSFLFANDEQKFFREKDTDDRLIEEFRMLYSRLDHRVWRKAFNDA